MPRGRGMLPSEGLRFGRFAFDGARCWRGALLAGCFVLEKAGGAGGCSGFGATALALPGLPGPAGPGAAGAELAGSGQWPDTRPARTRRPLASAPGPAGPACRKAPAQPPAPPAFYGSVWWGAALNQIILSVRSPNYPRRSCPGWAGGAGGQACRRLPKGSRDEGGSCLSAKREFSRAPLELSIKT